MSQRADEHPRTGATGLGLAALGVVFGDIGTSPLYAFKTVFSAEHNAVRPDPLDVYGIVSLVFWSVMLVVTVKYVLLVMRADNDGEGGILALVALLRLKLAQRPRLLASVSVLGMVGAALFYGDSVITPAISVMSAVEGLDLVTAQASRWVLPASVVILTLLFVAQRFGTHRVGRAFGPVMALWFVTLAALGIPHIVAHPQILTAISPHYAVVFAVERPLVGFIAMGGVVLCITGAEALYADMGHFGASPIRLAWFAVVLPALVINYFGQGAMILGNPETAADPFYLLAPSWALLPLVVLATAATVIASQAVISGAFSVSQQAAHLRLLPRLQVTHTSREEGGQIYVGAINWLLYVGVLALIAIFQSSQRLATAYGLAVTGTLLLTTTLFLFLAHHVWRWPAWRLVLFAVPIGVVELLYLVANVAKVFSGGWLPLLIASVLLIVMSTWATGQAARSQARARLEGSLDEFVRGLRRRPPRRVPGVAVFPHPDRLTTPLALRDNTEFNHVLHRHIVIVSVVEENVPHVAHVERVSVDDLGYVDDGIVHVRYRVGFNDSQDIPKALALARGMSPEMEFDPGDARYFLSVLRIGPRGPWHMAHWRKRLFVWLAANEANRTTVFHLPPEHTIVMGAELKS